MTTYYVDSAAGGNNDGSDWTNAWTSLASSTGVAAGSIILVDDGHSQDPGASATLAWANGTIANPVRLICVDKGNSNALSTGATFAQTVAGRSLSITGNLYVDGMTFRSGDAMTLGGASAEAQCWVNCTLAIVASTSARTINITGNGSGQRSYYESCAFSLNATVQTLSLAANTGSAEMRNCTITVPASHVSIFTMPSRLGNLELSCCSLPSATNLVGTLIGGSKVHAKRCSIGSYTSIIGTISGAGGGVLLESCVSGNISDTPQTFTGRYDECGKVVSTTAKYRTNGASDGTNSYAFEMTPTALAEEQINAIKTPPLTRWVAGGSEVTCTLYVAGPAEIYNDEVWMEVEGPDNTASPNTTTRGYWYSSRLPMQGSRAALTTDSESTWNGSDVNTKRKIVHAFTPQQDGPVVIRACYAKTSGAAIAVDPKIEVT